MPGPELKITTLNAKPYGLPIEVGRRLIIGRAPQCDIVLPDRLVSSRHAELYWAEGRLRVRDLGSTNGIFINGVRRTEAALRVGDAIRAGNSVLEVRSLDVAPEEHRDERTDRTQIDPFSVKLSLEDVPADLARAPVAGAAADLVRQRLTILYRLGQDVNTIEKEEVWLERVGRLVREMIGPERFAVLAFGEGAIAATVHKGRATFERDWRAADPARAVYVPPAFVAQVVEEQKAILYQNALLEPRFFRDPEAKEAGIRTAMAAPLVTSRGVRGVLYLDRAAPPEFAPDDLHLLGVVANQCAVMFENVRLYDEARRALASLREAQDQLIRAEKMSSIGELVGEIAHEINNPLAGILGFAQLLLDGGEVPDASRESVKKIVEQAMRVKRIVEKLLIFARRTSGAFEPLSVNEVVTAAIEFKEYDFRAHKIEVERSLDPSNPLVSGNRTELEQVLVNILHNADQALAPAGKGKVAVATRRAGAHVEISVCDDGPGIAPEILPKIFDPFFTTKPLGIGTGLGLTVSYGIVRRHGGEIRVKSEPGRGATFEIALPLLSNAPEESAAPPAPGEAAASAGRTSAKIALFDARVLVIEDEEAIRETTSSYLARRGYRVTLAERGKDAIDALRRGDRFDAIVTDLRLPDTDGWSIYEQAVVLDPRLAGKVVVMTGDTANPECAAIEARRPGTLLPKPFDLADLEARIRRAIEG
jgi:signal transduction histidine kinase/CheY-like chemotaxis protein